MTMKYTPDHEWINQITDLKQAKEALRENLSATESILETTQDCFARSNFQGELIDVNPAFIRQSGYTREELLRMHISDLEVAMDATEIANRIERLMKNGHDRFETRHRRKDGSVWDAEASVSMSKIADGYFFAFLRDISERKRMQEQLIQSENRWKFAIEGAGDALWELNLQTGAAFYSRRYKEMLGFTDDDPWVATDEEWSKRVHPDDMPDSLNTMQPYIDGKSGTVEVEFRMLGKDGRWRWILGRGMVASRDSNGKAVNLIGVNTDIFERKQMEEQVRQLAFYDALTQLPNRRMLFDRLSQAMAASKRSLRYGAVMLLDLDNFKPVNDQHGHMVGDLLLSEAAGRLSGCVREVDTVARFGGDEFVVLLSSLDVEKAPSTAQAQMIAEKIRIALSAPFVISTQDQAQTDVCA